MTQESRSYDPTFGLSVEQMLNNLNDSGVAVKIYSPNFFSASNDWHIDLEQRGDNVKLEIETRSSTLLAGVRDIYRKWHKLMTKNLRETVGNSLVLEHQPQEPPAKEPLEELHREALGDDEMPF